MPTLQKKSSFFAASNCVPINNEKIPKAHKGDKKTAELLENFKKSPHSINENLKPLYTYLQSTEHYIKRQWQPDSKISERESKNNHDNIKRIIRNENARKPDLNLFFASSIQDLVKQLKTLTPPFHQRFIFKDSDATQHFIFADIKTNSGVPPSIILIDSSTINHFSTHALYIHLQAQLKSLPLFKNMVASIVETKVQSSLADCLIFCSSFALKAHKHQALFSQWHTRQQEHADIAPDKLSKNRYHDTFKENGYLVYSPYGLLPVDFFKHTHSKKIIDKELSALWAAPFETIHTQQNLYAEMLTLKKQQSEQRYISNGEKMDFLTSIEYKRRALILRALTATSLVVSSSTQTTTSLASCGT